MSVLPQRSELAVRDTESGLTDQAERKVHVGKLWELLVFFQGRGGCRTVRPTSLATVTVYPTITPPTPRSVE